MIMMIGLAVYDVFKGKVVSVGELNKCDMKLKITLTTQYTHDLLMHIYHILIIN